MYWQIYAYIIDGIVKGTGVYEPLGAYTNANMVAKNLFGNDAFAVDVTYYPVQAGDTYIDGAFYRDGEEVKRLDPIGDDIYDVKLGIAELGELVAELLGGE